MNAILDFLSIQPEQLFNVGIGIGAIALVFALVSSIFLVVSRKHINRKLDQEFGKKVR